MVYCYPNRACDWCKRETYVVVITAICFHSIKPKLRFCAGSNHACGVSEICDSKYLWPRSQLGITSLGDQPFCEKKKIFSGIIYPFLLSYQFQVSDLLWAVSNTGEKGEIILPPTLCWVNGLVYKTILMLFLFILVLLV